MRPTGRRGHVRLPLASKCHRPLRAGGAAGFQVRRGNRDGVIPRVDGGLRKGDGQVWLVPWESNTWIGAENSAPDRSWLL